MIRRMLVASALLALGLSVGGCADSGGGPNAEASPAVSVPGGAGNEGVPDACGLVAREKLQEILGFDPGDPTPNSVSPDRSVCIYSNGVITAVEIAENYEASRDIIESNGSTTTDVAGIGTGAYYDSNGQLIAKGQRYFVGFAAGGVSIERMTEVVKIMLTNAGDTA